MHAKEWKALAVLRVQLRCAAKCLGYFYYKKILLRRTNSEREKKEAHTHIPIFMYKSCHRKLLAQMGTRLNSGMEEIINKQKKTGDEFFSVFASRTILCGVVFSRSLSLSLFLFVLSLSTAVLYLEHVETRINVNDE